MDALSQLPNTGEYHTPIDDALRATLVVSSPEKDGLVLVVTEAADVIDD